jgi:uncharacterized YigZ family protein
MLYFFDIIFKENNFMDSMTVKINATAEFTEKKSKFIGHAFYVTSEEETVACINSVKAEHSAATHNVYAYILRLCGTQKFNDDGEPQGTSGMTVLSVIKNNKLVDVCIVVTRYFGGILLGAGGLVRAYSKAASMALEASGKVPILLMSTFRLEYSYDLHNSIQRILEKYEAAVVSQSFLEKVAVEAILPDDKFLIIKETIKNTYYKNIDITELKKEYSRGI